MSCRYKFTFATEKFAPNAEITLCMKFFDASDCRYYESLGRIVEVSGTSCYGYCRKLYVDKIVVEKKRSGLE